MQIRRAKVHREVKARGGFTHREKEKKRMYPKPQANPFRFLLYPVYPAILCLSSFQYFAAAVRTNTHLHGVTEAVAEERLAVVARNRFIDALYYCDKVKQHIGSSDPASRARARTKGRLFAVVQRRRRR